MEDDSFWPCPLFALFALAALAALAIAAAFASRAASSFTAPSDARFFPLGLAEDLYVLPAAAAANGSDDADPCNGAAAAAAPCRPSGTLTRGMQVSKQYSVVEGSRQRGADLDNSRTILFSYITV